jgi:hypothetical protein
MKPIVFDGKIAYICPHCGTEQRFVEVEWEQGSALASFRIEGQRVLITNLNSKIDLLLPVSGDSLPLLSVHRGGLIWLLGMCCPRCKMRLNTKKIEEGFFRWLKRLKERNPKRYAEILSGLL